MNKFSLIVLLLGFVTLVGCKKDDDKSMDKMKISGLWKVSEFQISGQFAGSTYSAVGVDLEKVTMNMKEDGTYESEGESITVDVTISVFGEEIKERQTTENPFGRGTWEKDGDFLLIINEGDTEVQKYDIVELSENKLGIKMDGYPFAEGGSGGDFNAKITFIR